MTSFRELLKGAERARKAHHDNLRNAAKLAKGQTEQAAKIATQYQKRQKDRETSLLAEVKENPTESHTETEGLERESADVEVGGSRLQIRTPSINVETRYQATAGKVETSEDGGVHTGPGGMSVQLELSTGIGPARVEVRQGRVRLEQLRQGLDRQPR